MSTTSSINGSSCDLSSMTSTNGSTTSSTTAEELNKVAQNYYDSDDAFIFYQTVWGGESIHVGLYEGMERKKFGGSRDNDDRIKEASDRAMRRLFEVIKTSQGGLTSESRMCDMGSGYAGTARYAATTYGCTVLCVDLSEQNNKHARELTRAAGLSDKVLCPKPLSFFDTEEPAASHDLVVSQDALLHAGSLRHKAIAEAARILKPGGYMVFSDIMQADTASAEDLGAVFQRIQLENLGSPATYKAAAKENGLSFVRFEDHTANLAEHYSAVHEALLAKRRSGAMDGVSEGFATSMLTGLGHWVDAAKTDSLRWGFLVFRKDGDAS